MYASNINKCEFCISKYFCADWCQPCVAFKPRYEALSAEFITCEFAIVDDELGESVCTEENVSTFPTVKIFKNGTVVETVEGAKEDQLRQLLSGHSFVIAAPSPIEVVEVAPEKPGNAKTIESASRISSTNSMSELHHAIDKSIADKKLLVVVS